MTNNEALRAILVADMHFREEEKSKRNEEKSERKLRKKYSESEGFQNTNVPSVG